ncbi:MAG: VOC family protein [Thermoplasmatota archaeon]
MATSKKTQKRAATKKAARPAKRPSAVRTGAAKAAPRKIRSGFISHTELASSDPAATKAWCQKALGWKFGPAMPTPNGDYHMWSFGENQGGGIRSNMAPESPGSVPYVEVPDIKAAFAKATAAGASVMMPPDAIPGGMGYIGVVQAPGGVAVGFWAPK